MPQGRQKRNLLVRAEETCNRPSTGGPDILTISWELAIGAGRSVAHSTHLTLQRKMDSMRKSRFEGSGCNLLQQARLCSSFRKHQPWESYSESLRDRMGNGSRSLGWNGREMLTGPTTGIALGTGFSRNF